MTPRAAGTGHMLRNFVAVSPLTFVTVTAVVVQAKLLAVVLGPEGTGIYFLGISFLTLFGTAAGLGMSQSLTKLVPESRSHGRLGDIWQLALQSLLTVGVLSVALVLVLALFQHPIRTTFLDSRELKRDEVSVILVLAAIGTAPAAWNLALNGFLRGLQSIRQYVVAGSATTVLLVVCVVGFAVLGGSKGALYGTVVGQLLGSVVLLVAAVSVSRRQGLPFAPTRDMKAVQGLERRLVWFGATALIAVLAPAIGQNVTRTFLANRFDLVAVGFFAAAWSISNRLPALIYQTFSVYTMPRISELGTNWTSIVREQNHALRLGLLCATPVLCAMAALAKWVIPLLLSSKFLPMTGLLRLMLIGELVSIVFWATSMALYPSGRPTLNALSEWSWWALFLPLVIIFSGWVGINGIGIAYIVAYTALFVVLYIWEQHHHGLRWFPENWRTIVASILSVSITVAIVSISGLSAALQLVTVGATLSLWLVVVVTKQEWSFARSKLSSINSLIGGKGSTSA